MTASQKARINTIRRIVEKDLARIEDAESPYTVFDLPKSASLEKVQRQYDRYKTFYENDNFESLEIEELAEKCNLIRNELDQALSEIKGDIEETLDESRDAISTRPRNELEISLSTDEEAREVEIVGETYLEDAKTFLDIGDSERALEIIKKVEDYLPDHPEVEPMKAYVRYRLQPDQREYRVQCEETLKNAIQSHPENPEILGLMTRFQAREENPEKKSQFLSRLENVAPSHRIVEAYGE